MCGPVGAPVDGASEPVADYQSLLGLTQKFLEGVKRENGFVLVRSLHAYHVLCDATELSLSFDRIREDLGRNQAGRRLTQLLAQGAVTRSSANYQIWKLLVGSLSFSGIDFESKYGSSADPQLVWDYTFPEMLVLSHTLLVAPVMQYYGPLTPKLDLRRPTREFERPCPLLVVGMVGDAVRGKFFERIERMAGLGDGVARSQLEMLRSPVRLQQKMRGLLRGLLRARAESGARGLHVDACLVGTGAFGGSVGALAQPFADSLNDDDLPFDSSKDEVCIFMFPPPRQPEELTLERMKCNTRLNPDRGLGSAPTAADDAVRVLVAGFDPVSLVPHGLLNRVVSAEGQLCHTTDMLYRVTGAPGRCVRVEVPAGDSLEPRTRDDTYTSVRFVPEAVLRELAIEEGHEAGVQLEAIPRPSARKSNGDCLEGWMLSHRGARGQTWLEAISAGTATPRRHIVSL